MSSSGERPDDGNHRKCVSAASGEGTQDAHVVIVVDPSRRLFAGWAQGSDLWASRFANLIRPAGMPPGCRQYPK